MNAFTRFFAAVFGGWFDKRNWTSIGTPRMTTAQVEVSEDTALNYAAVWCATRLLCGTGASLPLPVYSGKDDETRVKERSHPVYKLLNGAPNQEMTAYNFRSVMWQWQVNWGNAYAEIVREGNNPLAPVVSLHPLHPSRVKICRDDSGELYYEVSNGGTQTVELEPWQMLHIPSIITHDGFVGLGVIAHARETIGAGLAAEKSASSTFGAGKIPAIVVQHKGKLSDEVRKAFYKDWKELHGKPDGENVALLGGEAEAKTLMGFSATDSQFLESRQFDIEEIARWYGVPPHLLQHLLRATFNNIEELGIDFVRYGLNLWLEIWEQAIWQKLFTEREREFLFAEHNVDALMRGNAAARAAFYQAMTSAAIMTRNECRKLENLDPVDGGDVFLVQGATVPLDEDGKPESAFVSGGATAPPAGELEDDDDEGDEPPDSQADVMERVSEHLYRSIDRKLRWVLTKETKEAAKCAKSPQIFDTLTERFYESHAKTVAVEFGDTLGALAVCGASATVEAFVSDWTREGKTLLATAVDGKVNGSVLTAVEELIESQEWTERPSRAVERLKNATLVV